MLSERVTKAMRKTGPWFLVYPAGAIFAGEPHGPRLVAASTSEKRAVSKANKIGGTVERWAHGEPIASVDTHRTGS